MKRVRHSSGGRDRGPGARPARAAPGWLACALLAGALALAGAAGASGVWRPAPGTSWQWQLSGAIDTTVDASMVDLDLFDAPQATIERLHALGRTVICYFSAGSYESWRPDAGRFPQAVLGAPNGWPGERWLDVRQRGALAPIMRARLDLAVAKGCDGVEPDNVDGYANDSGFALTAADQLAYDRFLADEAHRRHLSIGLKNAPELVPELLDAFDWALVEQCFEYRECAAWLPFVRAGKAVFEVEYNRRAPEFCPQANAMDFDALEKRPSLDAYRRPCR